MARPFSQPGQTTKTGGLPSHDRPPLHKAAMMGAVSTLKQLLADPNCNINASDATGYTPLHLAVHEGRKDAVDLLLAAGADPNMMNRDGRTSVHYAARMGYVDILEQLFNHRASLEEPSGVRLKHPPRPWREKHQERTPLHDAAESGGVDSVRWLLDKGVNIDPLDSAMDTPAGLAAKHGQPDVLRLLISRGADINKPYHKNQILPLHHAVFFGNTLCATILLDAGAKADARSGPGGDTPLRHAAFKGFALLARYLVDAGANPDKAVSEKSTSTPLMLALNRRQLGVAMTLLEKGANPNQTNDHKSTPLHMAAWYGDIEVVRLLLKKGADPLAQDENGLRPLDEARFHQQETVTGLLKAAQDAAEKQASARTPGKARQG